MIPAPRRQPPRRAAPGAHTPAASSVPADWHGLWALAVAAGLGLVLATGADVPASGAAALACGAAPGVAGWLDRRRRRGPAMLAVWAVGGGLAVALGGGVTGPLSPWCAAPLVAAMAYGGVWRAGAAAAFAVVAAVAVAGAGGGLPAPPQGTVGLAFALIALVTLLGGAAGALMLLSGAAAPPPTAPSPDTDERVAAAEAARRRAEAEARGKSRFLANMSHELRTPLNAIMGFSDMMRAGLFGELSPRYGEYAALIHESGQHLLDLINDVLDVSKIEADRYELRLETFDAREEVEAVLRLMRTQAAEAGVALRHIVPNAPVCVAADRRALKQIMLNLVSNALKFTPRGGSVTVAVAAAAGALEIEVTDTGVGIAPEDLARLGAPYEQAGDASDRARGTGLGLSLVRAFARLHGGELSLESRLGEGTAASVRLPVLTASPAPATD